ncbi:MAG: glycerate kinase [Nitrospiraceae bacterium]|nr:glycerate kinase [Nitrospiraceae bacterium]
MNTVYHDRDASAIFLAALDAVEPYQLVRLNADKVRSAYRSANAKRLVAVGFGKASLSMGRAIEDSLADILEGGILVTKRGSVSGPPLRKLKIIEAGHPIPDEYGYVGTAKIIRLLQEADEHTLVLCLISGGGSALLVSPCNGISLKDKQSVSELLLKSGASISEFNTVRKHLSKVKGGRLAELAGPATVMSLILSDVVGDRLDVIASGPTSPDSTTFRDALRILDKYDLLDQVPEPVLRVIGNGIEGLIPETPDEDDPLFLRVTNSIIGNNRIALDAAKRRAEELGYHVKILSSDLQGEARHVGEWLAAQADMARTIPISDRRYCLLSGGETTVTVRGPGLGGRNTELALAFAIAARGRRGITLLSAGTDGSDGPTDTAGAIADGYTFEKAVARDLDPAAYLDNNDSYHFFKGIGGLLTTGPTGTNVMDIQIILIDA